MDAPQSVLRKKKFSADPLERDSFKAQLSKKCILLLAT